MKRVQHQLIGTSNSPQYRLVVLPPSTFAHASPRSWPPIPPDARSHPTSRGVFRGGKQAPVCAAATMVWSRQSQPFTATTRSFHALSCQQRHRDWKSSPCLSHRLGHPIKPDGFDAVARPMGRSREDPVNDPPPVTSADVLRWLAGSARMKALAFAIRPGTCRNNAAR